MFDFVWEFIGNVLAWVLSGVIILMIVAIFAVMLIGVPYWILSRKRF